MKFVLLLNLKLLTIVNSFLLNIAEHTPEKLDLYFFISKMRLFKYIENFTTKNWKFLDKNSDIFHNSA